MLLTAKKSLVASAYGEAIFIYNGASSFVIKAASQVVAMTLNNEATLLICVTQDKKLIVYEMNSTRGEIVASREVPRNTTSLVAATYQHDGNVNEAILIAGNAGEVNAYPLPDVNGNEKSLLQHTTSIITDVSMSTNGKYLLSADRDEKIRISNFPATTLVQSYCLGHRQCVRKIAVSVATPSLFVSVGLDDALNLWNIETGALIHSLELPASETKQCGLSVCPITNRIALVRNSEKIVRFFAIQNEKLVGLDLNLNISSDAQPTNVLFNESGHLFVGFKQTPFLLHFDMTSETHVLKKIAGFEAFAQIAKTIVLAYIALGDEAEDDGDSDDGELRKKKVKVSNWKSKMPGHKSKTQE
ncbi:hypothetical protein THRCLA_03263 [Thraustotheca clavata]|uniref:Uncharacterized protein n=1 Tax=Thraustotheca clavata TaxID=74557 RepID=A0A1W0A2K7_9STRA|nr:hypothetical protein THRCLA_03263 [Thraustotheca clavata]